MHLMLATDYGTLQDFFKWGLAWLASGLASVTGFVFSFMNPSRRRWAFGLSFFSLGATGVLGFLAWLPSLDWHPNDRAVMLRAVMCSPWLSLITILILGVRRRYDNVV